MRAAACGYKLMMLRKLTTVQFLAGAPAINSRRFQELQESNTPNSVPSKLGCRCITHLDLGSQVLCLGELWPEEIGFSGKRENFLPWGSLRGTCLIPRFWKVVGHKLWSKSKVLWGL